MSYSDEERKIISAAARYAAEKHNGQVRRYVGGPYVAHPTRVAKAAMELNLPCSVVIAGYLHDVLEDCCDNDIEVTDTGTEICHLFGKDVLYYVLGMSDFQKPSDGNRAVRKARVCKFLSQTGDKHLHTLKILDLIDNAPSIIEHDKKFAKIFCIETKALIKALEFADKKSVAKLESLLLEVDT